MTPKFSLVAEKWDYSYKASGRSISCYEGKIRMFVAALMDETNYSTAQS